MDKNIPSAGINDMKSVKPEKVKSSKNHIGLLYAVGKLLQVQDLVIFKINT